MTEPDWQPITEAPRDGGDLRPPLQYGPFVLVRAGDLEIRARWRSDYRPSLFPAAPAAARARWEDRWGQPLAFVPTEWRADGTAA